MWLKITNNYSPNFALPKRPKKKIKHIVIHYTGMKNESLAIKRLCDQNTKVSSHYFIKKNGKVIQLVPDLYEAWHAGKSSWKKVNSLNKSSIGIELVNKGHEFGYEKFPNSQILKLIKLCKLLKKKYRIKPSCILGHSDIAPLRKLDPGEKFPWQLMSKKGLGVWYPREIKNKNNLDKKKIRNIFFSNLHKIGYRYFNKTKKSQKDKLVIKAFQRRFIQSKINGRIDIKTLKISHFLAHKVKN